MLPHTARFVIDIDGIHCREPVSNGLSDDGDDVWVAWHGAVFNRDGPVGTNLNAATAIHGHRNHPRVRIQAGTRRREGGLWRGDRLERTPGSTAPSEGGFPTEAREVTLTHGENALVLVPTVWRAHGDGTSAYQVPSRWAAHLTHIDQATAAVRLWVDGDERNRVQLRGNSTVEHDWWELTWFSVRGPHARVPDGCDRPIGCTSYGELGLFPPNVIVLNYAIGLELQHGPGRVSGSGGVEHTAPQHLEATYEDRDAAGHYAVRLRVTSLTPPWLSPRPPLKRFSLGRLWTVREGDWTGVWTRRRPSAVFDAEWVHTSGEHVRDTVEVERIDGAAIELRRGSFDGVYRGEVAPDLRSISGTASWYAPGEGWTATIAS